MEYLKLNMNKVEKKLIDFIIKHTVEIGFNKIVLGLSGGIDSALSAFLAAKAIGAKNVLGIMMPYKTSSQASLDDAKLVIETIGINHKIIEITPMIDAYFMQEKEMTPLRKGNKMARERMSILFDYSAKEKALVIGTSNKTERMLGYSTQFGDSACAFNPLGDLYKAQIWQLSQYMGIPEALINKKPTADLWEGQTDENELGFTYSEADEILYRIVELNKNTDEIISEGFDKNIVSTIQRKIKAAAFKREMPPICDIQNLK